MGMASAVNAARPVLAGTIVAVLVAGIAVAVIRPGDLGGDGGLDAAGPATSTTLAGDSDPVPPPEGSADPETTAPPDANSGDSPTPAPTPAPTTAPAPTTPPASEVPTVPTTVPAVPGSAPAPSPAPDPPPVAGPTGELGSPPTLAHTGRADGLAPLAVALLLAGAGAWRATRSDLESAA
jgi:hypothetical protein